MDSLQGELFMLAFLSCLGSKSLTPDCFLEGVFDVLFFIFIFIIAFLTLSPCIIFMTSDYFKNFTDLPFFITAFAALIIIINFFMA